VAADQAMYRAKSRHKLDKISNPPVEVSRSQGEIELDNNNLATVSVN
jgi:hypothetical protein